MKILLLGANGQVGWELERSLAPLGQLQSCNRHTANLEDLDSIKKIIHNYVPDIIVNAAAYTDVDKAESEENRAYSINYKAVDFLARESKRIDAWFIHYSSDYVFDGKKLDPYVELDEPEPLSIYGKSKFKGEQSVVESGCKYIIFRTSWVYSTRGNNFVKTMIRLGKEKDRLNIVSDQIGAPTSARLIADISSLCLYRLSYDKNLAKNVSGIYHLSSSGKTSWYGLAKYIINESKNLGDTFLVGSESIHPISTSEYQLPAIRPHNSLLKTQKICNTFSIHLPYWKVPLKRTLQEIYL